MAARLTSPSCSYCLELQIDRLSLVASKTFAGGRSLGRFACFGLNAKWKFIESLKKYRFENELILVSCSLYIIHRASKTGAESTYLELKKVLKEAFTLLHDSLARGNDYVSFTGSNIFPLLFCAASLIKDRKLADALIIV